MPMIRLRDYRSETIEGQVIGTFELSDAPEGAWIGRFEECLGQLGEIAVAVVGARVRTQLSEGQDIHDLVRLVQQCIGVANQNGNGHRVRPPATG